MPQYCRNENVMCARFPQTPIVPTITEDHVLENCVI